jgi:hypothetical protein
MDPYSAALWFEYGYGGYEERDRQRILRVENGDLQAEESDGYGDNDRGGQYMPIRESGRPQEVSLADITRMERKVLRRRRKRMREGTTARLGLNAGPSRGEDGSGSPGMVGRSTSSAFQEAVQSRSASPCSVGSDDSDDDEGGSGSEPEPDDGPILCKRCVPINVMEVNPAVSIPQLSSTVAVAVSSTESVLFGGILSVPRECTSLAALVTVQCNQVTSVETIHSEHRTPAPRSGHILLSFPFPPTGVPSTAEGALPSNSHPNPNPSVASSSFSAHRNRVLLIGGNSNPFPRSPVDGIGLARMDCWFGDLIDVVPDTPAHGNQNVPAASATATSHTYHSASQTPSKRMRWSAMELINGPTARYASAAAVVPNTAHQSPSTSLFYLFGGHSGLLKAGAPQEGDEVEEMDFYIADDNTLPGGMVGQGASDAAGERPARLTLGEENLDSAAVVNHRLLGDLHCIVVHWDLQLLEGKKVETIGHGPSPRCGHSMTFAHRGPNDADGALYVFGGISESGATLPELYCLRLGSMMWRDIALPYRYIVPARAWHSAVYVPDRGSILFVGGESRSTPVQSYWEFVLEYEDWQLLDFPSLDLYRPFRERQHRVNARDRSRLTQSTSRSGSQQVSVPGLSPAAPLAGVSAAAPPTATAISSPSTTPILNSPATPQVHAALFPATANHSNPAGRTQRLPFPRPWDARSNFDEEMFLEPETIDRTSAVHGAGCAGVALTSAGVGTVLVIGGTISSRSSIPFANRLGTQLSLLHVSDSLKQQVALKLSSFWKTDHK